MTKVTPASIAYAATHVSSALLYYLCTTTLVPYSTLVAVRLARAARSAIGAVQTLYCRAIAGVERIQVAVRAFFSRHPKLQKALVRAYQVFAVIAFGMAVVARVRAQWL